MKKLAMLLVSLFLLAGVNVFAQDELSEEKEVTYYTDGSAAYDTFDPAGNPVTVVIDPPIAYPSEEEDKLIEVTPDLDITDVTIPVYAVADEEYRSAHSNWQSKLNTIIETADNAYIRDFNINWSIQGYYSWTSNGNNSSQILADLASDGSGLPDGLCMGFTRDSKFTAGGIAYVYSSNPGTGYSVCKDQGNSSTIYALRHEIGHNYGCYHDFDPVVCLMNYTYSYSIDYFDNTHDNLISGRTNWF